MAIRAGSNARHAFGDDDDKLAQYAWFSGNSRNNPEPVAELKPNHFGLYDVQGNVSEMVSDLHGNDGSERVYIGGCWWQAAARQELSNRSSAPEDQAGPTVGFRLAREVKQ